MDEAERKRRMVERYYRGAARQEQRALNEQRKKQRLRRDAKAGREDPERGETDASTFDGTITAIHRDRLVVLDDAGDARDVQYQGVALAHAPAVGDRITCRDLGGVLRAVDLHARRTTLSRPDPGNPHRRRVLAANVDTAVVVLAAKEPGFKPTLIDRFLVALDTGGVEPVVCVNKVDLCDDAERAALGDALAGLRGEGIPCLLASAVTGEGIPALHSLLAGRTVVFSGHSGVGKSALLNALDTEGARATGAGRAYDGKGRHTTTHSELRVLGEGTRLVDTPGIREFGLWDVDPAVLRTRFPGIRDLAPACRFRDCAHGAEPDCAVRAAVEDGRLAASRYVAYRKLLAEVG